jgi:hypothetical protein
MCAGPYSAKIMGLEKEPEIIENLLWQEQNGTLDKFLKPGFTRINLHYSMTREEVPSY